jgi:hypothetical protein
MIWLFVELRASFTKAPVLAHFDPARLIRLLMDVSGCAIAGIIAQQQDDAHNSADGSAHVWALSNKSHWHWVAFWSWSMSPAEQN